MKTPLAMLLLAALFVCMSAIAATPRAGVNEFLDERTGATVTVVREPLIFALERSTLAAHARDYISLTAVEVDRSGQTQLCVLGYFWSTIDRRAGSGASQAADKTLALFADAGHMLLGWNDVPERDPAPLSEVRNLFRFSQYLFPAFGAWRYLTDTPNRHTYYCYQKMTRETLTQKDFAQGIGSEANAKPPDAHADLGDSQPDPDGMQTGER